MSLDTTTANAVLARLRPFPVAVTTVSNGFANGLMSLSAGSGQRGNHPRGATSHYQRDWTLDNLEARIAGARDQFVHVLTGWPMTEEQLRGTMEQLL